MSFVLRKCTHLCTPPMLVIDTQSGVQVVEGDIGDVWRCDDCQRLWQCRRTCAWPGRAWWKPTWFTRLRFDWWRRRKEDAGLGIFDGPSIDLDALTVAAAGPQADNLGPLRVAA